MKKRILAMLVALTMIVVAVGCGKGYKVGDNGEVYNDYVKVKKWKELEVERVEPTPVTDEDVNLSIESNLQTLTSYVEITDRGAQNGDQVTLDFVGKLDGVAFEGGTGSDTFILGEGSFVDGFQEGVVGHKAGETFDVPLTFPENYGGDLGGKAVVFTMTLNKVEEVVVPELTDETVQKLNSNVKTVEEYKAQVKADLEKSNQETANQAMRDGAVAAFFKQCEAIDYPEDRLEDMVAYVEDYYTSYFEYMVYMYYQTTLDAYMESTGATVEDMLGKTFEEAGKEQLMYELAFELIAEVESIETTDEEYQAFLEERAEAEGHESAEAYEESFNESAGEDACRTYFLQEKVADFLYENCVIVEPTETDDTTATE